MTAKKPDPVAELEAIEFYDGMPRELAAWLDRWRPFLRASMAFAEADTSRYVVWSEPGASEKNAEATKRVRALRPALRDAYRKAVER